MQIFNLKETLTPFKIVSESLMICFKQVSQNGTIDFYLLIYINFICTHRYRYRPTRNLSRQSVGDYQGV